MAISSPSPGLSCELVNAIQNDFSNAELLFRDSFERGIKLLVRRRLGTDSQAYADATIAATLEEVRRRAVKWDENLPGLIRRQLNRIFSATAKDRVVQLSEQSVAATEQTEHVMALLMMCPPREREMLRLFYVVGESETWICRAHDISLRRFRELRAATRRAVGLSLGDLRPKTSAFETRGDSVKTLSAARCA